MYRAAWALVAVPLLVAAFTVARPSPLPGPDLPPSFDQATAARLALSFAARFPSRTPGTADAAAAAAWVQDRLDDYQLTVEQQAFEADIPGRGRVQLTNLVARPVGGPPAEDVILVIAHRDNVNLSPGADDNASGTAALIELARNLSSISLGHGMIFASVDGGAYGNVGAAELAKAPELADSVLAVVSLDSLAGGSGPRLEFAGDRPSSPAEALLATADASILDETGARAGHPTALDQLVDLAFPFSFYGQSPFAAAGISAVTLTSAGDRPPRPADDVAATFDPSRLGQLGRAAQRLIISLDAAAEIATGTDTYVYLGGRFVRGFAVAFLLVVAILPALVATADLAARVHRRGIELAPAVRSYGIRLLPWTFAAGLAALFSVVGLFPNGSARPLSPDTGPGVDWPVGALAALAALSGAVWLLLRPRLLPRHAAARADELAGHLVVMIVLCALSVGLAFANPFSLLLVLPSLHAWLWIPHARDSHLALRAGLYAAGFAGPLLVVISFAVRFALGLDAPWYVAALFSVGYAPLALFLAFVPWAAAAGQAGAILFGRYAGYPPENEPDRALLERQEVDLGASGELPGAVRNEDERVGLSGRHDHV